MKTIQKLTIVLMLFVTLVAVSGCATAEKPDFQGYKHSSPSIDDYYPPKAK
ncbi:MAG: hypothetical protein AB1813_16470 [Verrucomicrobiota bacterium]